MNSYKEWMMEHENECENCIEISERTDISEAEKSNLMADCQTDSFGNLVDTVHEAYKDQLT